MQYKADVEFPCGMKYRVEMETGLFFGGIGHIESKLGETICPLHGQACKRR